jgi:hypothetical protein
MVLPLSASDISLDIKYHVIGLQLAARVPLTAEEVVVRFCVLLSTHENIFDLGSGIAGWKLDSYMFMTSNRCTPFKVNCVKVQLCRICTN